MILSSALPVKAQKINPPEVKEVMEQVADWQIIHFRDTYSGKNGPHHPLHWTNAAQDTNDCLRLRHDVRLRDFHGVGGGVDGHV